MKKNICGILIDDSDRRTLIHEIEQRLKEQRRTVIYTPNPIMAQNAKKDEYFMKILNSSDYNVPDGNGIILASRLLNTPIPKRICGIELAEDLLKIAAQKQYRIFLYGGREGVAALAAKKLSVRYPNLKICGVANGFINDSVAFERIKRSSPDAVYVCLGSPKQEKWIYENAPRLRHTKLFMGLGGSLDVWSESVARAPAKIRSLGFEWLWRMAVAPKRLKDLPKLVTFGASTLLKSLSNVGIMHR
ncbi:MAG: WecB/TagA/CpsF family glycosyltransferase [Clostridia bacterium]|nr:WecB/TagA/CpsF family glycosyltransferase [Clostridia bacterium]